MSLSELYQEINLDHNCSPPNRGALKAPTHSARPFEFPGLPRAFNFDAFGFGRCLWGTDWTRAVELLNYEQGVEAFRVTDSLSDSERSELMGGTLTKIYKWSPQAG